MVKMLAILVCCALVPVASAFAQENYPTRTIQIIDPMAAGGSLDLLARIYAEKMREYLGQPVLVVNKPGAGQALAISYAATSKPDGYTLYISSGVAFGYLRVMNPAFTYGLENFTPLAGIAKFPQVVVVSKDLPINSLADLIAYAKKNPETLSCASTGYASGDHLSFEAIKIALNLSGVQHVPFNGVAPAITALAGGQVQMGVLPFSALIDKQVEAGNIRALVLLSSTPSPFRPSIPTVVQAGYPDLVTRFYLSFWAPAKTPAPIVKKLEDAIRKTTEDKGVRARVEQLYDEPDFLNPQDLEKYAESQVAKWGGLIKKLNITLKQQ